MRILSQETPNPNARKFITEKELINNGMITIHDKKECLTTPLALAIINLPSVTQIHFFENSITVNKTNSSTWEDLEPDILKILEKLIKNHDPAFKLLTNVPDKPILTGPLKEIDQILNRTIRPGLQGDGGDIEVVGLEKKVLTVAYHGACIGCPSAFSGTLMAIESILHDEYDSDLKVISI